MIESKTATGNCLLSYNILLLLVNSTLFFATQNVMLPVFPVYIMSIGGTERTVGLLVGVFSLSAVVFRVYFAKLAQRRQGKYLLGLAIFICSTAPLLYLVDLGWWYLVLVRVYHAASLSAFITASQTLLADLSTEQNRGRLFGYYNAASGVAMAVAPSLGNLVAVRWGYGAFFASVAMLGFAMIPAQLLLREPQTTPLGADQVSASISNMFKDRWIWTSSVSLFFVTMSIGALASFLPLQALALGLSEMGIYYTAFSLMFLMSGFISGLLSDKYGRKRAVLPFFILVVLGLALLIPLSNYVGLVLVGLLIGSGFGAINTVLLALVMDKTSPGGRSQAVSFFNNHFDLGFSTGAMLFGSIAAHSFGLLWAVMAGLTMLGFALLVFLLPSS